MNVFVLGTGRCGTVTFIQACRHITNYSSGHESRRKMIVDRVVYPANHIEADSRLAWRLGMLEQVYGRSAFYVHLTRDRRAVQRSYERKYERKGGASTMGWGSHQSRPPSLAVDR